MIKFLVKKTLGWLAMIFLAVNLTYFLASFSSIHVQTMQVDGPLFRNHVSTQY